MSPTVAVASGQQDRGAGAPTRKGECVEQGLVDLRDDVCTPAPHHLRTALAVLLEIPSEQRTSDEDDAIESLIAATGGSTNG